ncbi:Alpha beta-hydrolase [Mycena kentingensis (nom. inval.)]|nr:Alpha beta-hydrolase [Mycena kentingensis (nom. inval.)]
MLHWKALGAALLFVPSILAAASHASAQPKPFKINLSTQFKRLKRQVADARLPDAELYPGNGQKKGVPLESLRAWKQQWVTGYDWDKEQEKLNAFDHFTVDIEGLNIHFIHQKSKSKDAVPIILLHGWGGSFQQFVPMITPLTQQNGSESTGVAFDVVVPSLPGFLFSSAPKTQNWTIIDTARVLNTLMTEVLGYSKYAIHGTDWGALMGYGMYTTLNPSGTILGASFDFLPFLPPSRADIQSKNITLSPPQQITLQRFEEWSTIGSDYSRLAGNKPNDLGYTLYDNPVGQLAFIGGKYLAWSQAPPSPLYTPNNSTILTAVSLYALTDSVVSTNWIYAANPGPFAPQFVFPGPGTVEDAPPMVFSSFTYSFALWPEDYVKKIGNVVAYRVHGNGGHFAGLDNPDDLVEDIRLLASFF